MKKICITDMTLRRAAENRLLGFKERIELAKLLDKLNISAMELPQLSVGTYPELGPSRVMEMKFTYQTSRDALRSMQNQVQRVFASASLYISRDDAQAQKFAQLFSFLMERFDYELEASITPTYSLLCHGVGISDVRVVLASDSRTAYGRGNHITSLTRHLSNNRNNLHIR